MAFIVVYDFIYVCLFFFFKLQGGSDKASGDADADADADADVESGGCFSCCGNLHI